MIGKSYTKIDDKYIKVLEMYLSNDVSVCPICHESMYADKISLEQSVSKDVYGNKDKLIGFNVINFCIKCHRKFTSIYNISRECTKMYSGDGGSKYDEYKRESREEDSDEENKKRKKSSRIKITESNVSVKANDNTGRVYIKGRHKRTRPFV